VLGLVSVGILGFEAGWVMRVLRLIGRARVVVFCGVELRGVGPRRGAPISQAGGYGVSVGEHKASLEDYMSTFGNGVACAGISFV